MGGFRDGAGANAAAFVALGQGLAIGLNLTLAPTAFPLWAPCALVGLVALWLAARLAPAPPPRFVAAYTVALAVVAVALLAQASLLHDPRKHALGARDLMGFLYFGELFLAAACVAVAALRLRRNRLASPLTHGLQLPLLFAFPFGTAAFFWWVFGVRRRETI